MHALVFFCPTCHKATWTSVIETNRKVSDELKAEWIEMILEGYAVRTMPIEEAKVIEMCYTNHETK